MCTEVSALSVFIHPASLEDAYMCTQIIMAYCMIMNMDFAFSEMRSACQQLNTI
jgi:hypothetical protein